MRDYTDIERNGKPEAGSRKGKGTLANPAGIRSEANPAWIAGPAVGGPSLPGFVPSCCTGNEKSVTGREISVQDAKISCRDAKKSYRTGDFVTGSTQNGTGPAAAGDWGILKDELAATARFYRVVNNKAGMNTPHTATARLYRVGLGNIYDFAGQNSSGQGNNDSPLVHNRYFLSKEDNSLGNIYDSLGQNPSGEGNYCNGRGEKIEKLRMETGNVKHEERLLLPNTRDRNDDTFITREALAARPPKHTPLKAAVIAKEDNGRLKQTISHDESPVNLQSNEDNGRLKQTLFFKGRCTATARFHRVANNKDMNEPHDTIVRQQCIQHPAPKSLLFAHGSLLTAGLLTKKYYNPPSRREQGTTKNAHLSILEFMGKGDNNLNLFHQSSPWNANVLPLQGEVPRVLGAEGYRIVANNSKTAVAYET